MTWYFTDHPDDVQPILREAHEDYQDPTNQQLVWFIYHHAAGSSWQGASS